MKEPDKLLESTSVDELLLLNFDNLSDKELDDLINAVTERADAECYQVGIDYNIKDVELVDRLEDKLGLITLAMTMAYKAGVNYDQTFGTTSIWDTFIYRVLKDRKITIPFKGSPPEKTDLGGGHVKDPVVGRHEWICSFDLNSLYPHLIMQYNMSPETIVRDVQSGVTIEKILAGCLLYTSPSPRDS